MSYFNVLCGLDGLCVGKNKIRGLFRWREMKTAIAIYFRNLLYY